MVASLVTFAVLVVARYHDQCKMISVKRGHHICTYLCSYLHTVQSITYVLKPSEKNDDMTYNIPKYFFKSK